MSVRRDHLDRQPALRHGAGETGGDQVLVRIAAARQQDDGAVISGDGATIVGIGTAGFRNAPPHPAAVSRVREGEQEDPRILEIGAATEGPAGTAAGRGGGSPVRRA
ncbi:MAG: hypothetical protein R2862_09650 [Thermoanaerobaculia bacterium]